jgi:hypothetical protein
LLLAAAKRSSLGRSTATLIPYLDNALRTAGSVSKTLTLPTATTGGQTHYRRGSGQTHNRHGFSVGLLGPLILGSFLYFSTLICCICSHFGFLQFFENDDVSSVYWVLQNITFAGGPDHKGSLNYYL